MKKKENFGDNGYETRWPTTLTLPTTALVNMIFYGIMLFSTVVIVWSILLLCERIFRYFSPF